MIFIGYAAAILIGISLGLIGGGGSILTVPVLVYLFHIDALTATSYSLFIVGVSSTVGSITYFKKNEINIKIGLIFGLPSIIAVFISRHYLLPAIPDNIIHFNHWVLTKNLALLLFFALLMIAVSYSMIKQENEKLENYTSSSKNRPVLLVLQGLTVGLLTGLLGAGGGFLIIPALVKFLKMPVKIAVGTSLMIIAINSLSGFTFSIAQHPIAWHLLITISLIAILGIILGSYFSKFINSKKLKPIFGWFVLLMGIYIITRELTIYLH